MSAKTLKVRIRRHPHGRDLPLPRAASRGSSGLDLLAAVDGSLDIASGTTALVPTGISVEVPEGHEAQVRPRSGLALKHGITVLNTPGTIDSDYRGEVGVILINHGKETFTVKRGDRIAQLVFSAVCDAVLEESEELGDTTRGDGGFGHTGM
ncbi:MAG: dUTP diphosphatase [Candidatus Eisenbacteria bacterium]